MKVLMIRIASPFLWVYHKTHWFTDREAWGIFRFFAILEAVGWSLLIIAIMYRRMGLPEAASVVSFAGHVHGIGFGLYFCSLFLLRAVWSGVSGVSLLLLLPVCHRTVQFFLSELWLYIEKSSQLMSSRQKISNSYFFFLRSPNTAGVKTTHARDTSKTKPKSMP